MGTGVRPRLLGRVGLGDRQPFGAESVARGVEHQPGEALAAIRRRDDKTRDGADLIVICGLELLQTRQSGQLWARRGVAPGDGPAADVGQVAPRPAAADQLPLLFPAAANQIRAAETYVRRF